MDIVEQAARIIDPAAFVEWISNVELSDVERARKAYMKSKALCVATQVLKLACKQNNLKAEMVRIELQGWRDLGVPVDNPEALKVIEQKFA